MQVCDQVAGAVGEAHKQSLEGQFDLFGGGGGETVTIPEIPMPNIPEYTQRERMLMEKEITGLYLSGHPMDEFRAAARAVASFICGDRPIFVRTGFFIKEHIVVIRLCPTVRHNQHQAVLRP